MTERPKLLWHSNAPYAPTGYGQQTALFTRELKEHYDLVISAFYGLEGNVIDWEGIPVLPGITNEHGNQTILQHTQVAHGGTREGLVLTLMDVWVLDPAVWRNLNVACWVPVDHEPAPEPVVGFFHSSGAVPIAMSRFGQRMLKELDPLYVPHAVDTSVYKPTDRKKARKSFDMPQDAFIVGMVAANKGNPSRKCFQEAFQAFKAFRDRHSDALLYLHTDAKGMFGGVNLPQLARDCGIPPEAMLYCDQYRAIHLPYPAKRMADVYSAMDVLLSPSAGEGFGVAVIEANACGVPAIVSDFSAQPEVCKAGWTVKGTPTYTPIGSWQFRPDVEDITDALNRCYALPEAGRKDIYQKAVEGAAEYDVKRVLTEHMLPALETAQERFEALKPMKVAA